jgi:hypothetical protein
MPGLARPGLITRCYITAGLTGGGGLGPAAVDVGPVELAGPGDQVRADGTVDFISKIDTYVSIV